MNHEKITPSRSFFLSTLLVTVFSAISPYGGMSWAMESSQEIPKINLNMGPEEIMEKIISILPEGQHIGEYLESIGPSNPAYHIIYACFMRDLGKVDKITFKEWKEQPILQTMKATGISSMFLFPGLMQALKDNTTIKFIDVSGFPLTDLDEKYLTEILDVNKRITLVRDHDKSHNSEEIKTQPESPKMGIDEYSKLHYPAFELALGKLESLNLVDLLETYLMIDAKSHGITSPFLLPGFVRALRENKTIKTLDCRGYKLTDLENDYIDQIIALNKNIKVIKDYKNIKVINDQKILSESSGENSEYSQKSGGKKSSKSEFASIETKSSKIMPMPFMAEDSLADLERYYKNGDIDDATYDFLKSELSPQELLTPLEKKYSNSKKHRIPVADNSVELYVAFKEVLDTLRHFELRAWLQTDFVRELKIKGIVSVFLLPDFILALQENKTIKFIDVRGCDLTHFEAIQISQILSVNKNIELIPNIDLLAFFADDDKPIKSTGKKYQKLESPSTTIKSSRGTPTPFLSESLLPTAEDSLADLERSYKNGEIDDATYELLKKELSSQVLPTPIEKKFSNNNITNNSNRNKKNSSIRDDNNFRENKRLESSKIGSFEPNEESYAAFKEMLSKSDTFNLSSYMMINLITTDKFRKRRSPFFCPGFVRALKENTTIKAIDCRSYDITKQEIYYLEQILEVNKKIRVIMDQDDVLVSSNKNSDFSINSTTKSTIKSKSPSTNIITPKIMPTLHLNKSFLAEEEVGNLSVEFLSKIKEDYASGKIDLDTYNNWVAEIERVKLEKSKTRDEIFENEALNLQIICMQNKIKELKHYQGTNVNEDYRLEVLIPFIKKDKYVTHLYLNNCQIDDAGAIRLADALKDNKTILYLDLRNNQIGPLGAQAFNNLFGSNCYLDRKPCLNDTLKTLQLQGNPLRPSVLKSISRALANSEFTKELDDLLKNTPPITIIEKPIKSVIEITPEKR